MRVGSVVPPGMCWSPAPAWCWVLSPGHLAPRSDLCGCKEIPWVQGKPHTAPSWLLPPPLHHPRVWAGASTGPLTGCCGCAPGPDPDLFASGGGRAPMPVSVSPATAARGQICPRDPPSFLHPLVLLIRAMTTVNGGRDVTDGMWGERKPPWPFQRLQ